MMKCDKCGGTEELGGYGLHGGSELMICGQCFAKMPAELCDGEWTTIPPEKWAKLVSWVKEPEPSEPFVFHPDKSLAGEEGVLGATNGERAERASQLAHHYLYELLHAPKHDQLEECNLSDIISDIGHWCDRAGVSFSEIIERGQNRWEEER